MPWSSQKLGKREWKGELPIITKTVFRDSERSRSGIALQSRQNIGFITFRPTPYITALLDKLKKTT